MKSAKLGNTRVALTIVMVGGTAAFGALATEEFVKDLPALASAGIHTGWLLLPGAVVAWYLSTLAVPDDRLFWLETRIGHWLRDMTREVARRAISDREHDLAIGQLASLEQRQAEMAEDQKQIAEEMRHMSELLAKTLSVATAYRHEPPGGTVLPFRS